MTGTAKTTRKGTAAAKSAAKSAAKTAATARKAAVKANAATDLTVKPAASNKAAAQPAPKKTAKTANRPTVPVFPPPVEIVQKRLIVVSDDERYRMIAEAAYYRAENRQFQSDPVSDWIEAEKEIAALLGKD